MYYKNILDLLKIDCKHLIVFCCLQNTNKESVFPIECSLDMHELCSDFFQIYFLNDVTCTSYTCKIKEKVYAMKLIHTLHFLLASVCHT